MSFGQSQAVSVNKHFVGKTVLILLWARVNFLGNPCLFWWFWCALSHLCQASGGILLSNTQLCNHYHIYLWYINLQIFFFFKAEYFNIIKINDEVLAVLQLCKVFCFKCKQMGIHTTITTNFKKLWVCSLQRAFQMFIAHISEQVRKRLLFLLSVLLQAIVGLAEAEVISFIAAGKELHFGLVPNHSPLLTTIP